MTRKLVLCFDGTNNQYAATNTNVVKLYAMLDRAKDDQLAYYQPGIGTMPPPGVWERGKKWVLTRLDLAIAWLLEDHVCDGYRYLMETYREGDQIFIFGFSRGAYTARALAAMIHKVGLLTPGNDDLISFAWDMFNRGKDREVYEGFRSTFSREVRVHFIGVWDTVSSVGWAWHPHHLQFTMNNPSVDIVRHAVALDERRCQFVQNLWTHTPEPNQDVLQVWFPGVHCDVGGGYRESEAGLSKIALEWMIEHAEKSGLRFNPTQKAAIIPAEDSPKYAAPKPAATKHESLKGLWWIVEYLPKPIHDPAHGYQRRWVIHRGRPRFVAEGSNIHVSVSERGKEVPTYKPTNLPDEFTTVR